MGLISFIKSAGASIFGGSEAKAAPADELKKELDKHGLDHSDVKVEVNGDKVTVSGTAKSTEEAEKIAIAVGNTKGVGTVQNDIQPTKAEPEFDILYRQQRRHAVGHLRAGVRQGQWRQVQRHLRGQQADADPIRTRSIRARCCASRRCRERRAATALDVAADPMGADLLINIDVPDLDRAVAFYSQAFGLAVTRRLGTEVVELGGWPVRLYLLQKPSGSIGAANTLRRYDRHWTPVHFDVAVDDVEAAVARALAAGARAETEIRVHAWGKIALMADPFGHGFCLIEFLGRGYDEIAD